MASDNEFGCADGGGARLSPARRAAVWGNLTRHEWLGDRALTAAGKALIGQLFRDLETNPHAAGPWAEAKLRLMAPFKR